MSGYYKKTPWTKKPPASVPLRKGGHWSIRGLVGAWDMREGAGLTARDVSCNGNDGTLTNMNADTDWVVGEYGRALDFDGTNDYVTAGNDSSLSFGNGTTDLPFTIVCWVKMHDATKFRAVGKINDLEGYLFGTDGSDKLRMALIDGSTVNRIDRVSTPTLTSSENEWTLLAMTYDGSSSPNGITLYQDGEVLASTTSTGGSYTAMNESAVNLRLGWYEAVDYANGEMAGTLLFNRQLSDTEIADLHANPNIIYEPRKTFIPTGGIIAAAGSMILRLLKLRNK